ncbi:hypothetical protein [Ferrovibrio sp.]|uniref:hypothetical protein n=1 Tax=Ferrovibrio sp. TaxID=1917215 RepID=UPI0035AE96C2
MTRISKTQRLHDEWSERKRQQYMTPDNIALIDEAKAMAATYQEAVNTTEAEAEARINGAEPSLIETLAKVYALVMVFGFDREGAGPAMPSHMLLTELGAKPSRDGWYSRPILKLVQTLFAALHERHRSQPSRYAKVIEFLTPDAEEGKRLHNLTPAAWSELFLTKFKEHGSIKEIVRAQQQQQKQTQKDNYKKSQDQQQQQHAEHTQRQQQQQEKARRKFFKKTPDMRLENQPDQGDSVVVLLRRDGNGYNAFKIFDHPAIADALLIRSLGWADHPIPEVDEPPAVTPF